VHNLALTIEGDLIETAPVENEAAFGKRLTSHAVALSATDTLRWWSRAKARARVTSSTLWILTIPKTGVLFKQLASLMKPPFASNNSSFGGGVKIRVVGFALVGSAGKIKSQFFSRSGGEE
jgi:hypothetical protein